MASVHRRAVNLELEDGAIVAVLPDGAPLHPWALTAPFDPSPCPVRAEVRASPGLLTIGPEAIALRSLTIRDLRLSSRPARVPAGVVHAVSLTGDLWARRRLGSGIASESSGDRDPFAPVLLGTLEIFRDGGPSSDLASLVGFGQGLTPSGDDALVGVLAGLDLAAASAPAACSLRGDLVATLTAERLLGTTRLSAQMLAAAADGSYPEPVLDLLEALAKPDADATAAEGAASTLLGLGHLSGADMLIGVVTALGRVLPGP